MNASSHAVGNVRRMPDQRRVCDLTTRELLEIAVARLDFGAGDWRTIVYSTDGHVRRVNAEKGVRALSLSRAQIERPELVDLTTADDVGTLRD